MVESGEHKCYYINSGIARGVQGHTPDDPRDVENHRIGTIIFLFLTSDESKYFNVPKPHCQNLLPNLTQKYVRYVEEE